jgi:signal transduction histidine kinase
MPDFFKQVFTTLTTPPGNLAYHLILAFAIVGAWQASFSHWRNSGFPQGRRMVLGLSLLLVAQLALFACAALTWQGVITSHVWLPPLDRAVALFSLVIIIWLWAFPETHRPADAGCLLLILFVLTASVLAGVWWSTHQEGTYFNVTWPDSIGAILAATLCLVGVLTLLVRQPNGWGIGLAMLGLSFLGYLVHWLVPQSESNYSGVVRLMQMAAYPLLFFLPQRFPLPVLDEQASPPSTNQVKTPPASNPRVLQDFLDLAIKTPSDQIGQRMTQAVAQALLADLCLLVSTSDHDRQLVVACGYDLIREHSVDGFVLDERLSPVTSNALRRGRLLRLPASSTSPDLLGFCQALNLGRAGHLLVAPFSSPGDDPVLGLILLSPYSNRGWTKDDQSYLLSIREMLAHILQQSQQVQILHQEIKSKSDALEEEQIQAEKFSVENERLRNELKGLVQDADQHNARAESLAAVLANQDEVQNTLAQLVAENKQLKETRSAQLVPEPANTEQLENELKLALLEVARLRAEKADSEQGQLKEPVTSGKTSTISSEEADVLASMCQELRQPMSSIVGYTDLMLGESVGILGAMQRKFLERIKASTERMGGSLDDIVRMTTIERGLFAITPETVNLGMVIDEAIATCATRFREKNINLRVSMPDQLPQMKADRDALQQIVLHLLQNAGTVTPPEGEICLHTRIEKQEEEPGFVLIQVSDSGGGIPVEDLSRVFSRLYRADNPLIQGLGETGVGLSIVKTLVEAHDGRVWVDTELGKGATFSILLPLAAEAPKKRGGQ